MTSHLHKRGFPPGGRWATSQGMLVYYRDSSGTYVAKNYWANNLAANTHTCPSS